MRQDLLHSTTTLDEGEEGILIPMKRAGSIRKIVLKAGDYKSGSPRDGATCTLDMIKVSGGVGEAANSGKIRRVTFCLGEGSECDVPPAVEFALRKFRLGERSRIEIRSSRVKLYPDMPETEEDKVKLSEGDVGKQQTGVDSEGNEQLSKGDIDSDTTQPSGLSAEGKGKVSVREIGEDTKEQTVLDKKEATKQHSALESEEGTQEVPMEGRDEGTEQVFKRSCEEKTGSNTERMTKTKIVDSEYVVELLHFTQIPGHWEVSAEQSLVHAITLKNKGTEFFKAEKYRLAKKYYKRAILYLQQCNRVEEKNRRAQLADEGLTQETEPTNAEPAAEIAAGIVHASAQTATSITAAKITADNAPATVTGLAKKSESVITTEETESQKTLEDSQRSGILDSESSGSSEICNVISSTKYTTTNSSNAVNLEPQKTPDNNLQTDILDSEVQGGGWKETENKAVSSIQLTLACYLNAALCYLKLGKNISALEACEKALEIEPTNEKGLYRSGLAHLAIDNLDLAVQDFSAILARDPNNAAAIKQLSIANSRLAEHTRKERMVYMGMFNRFAEHDVLKQRAAEDAQVDVFSAIGEWCNDLASGMMTLEQEMAAFGEKMPEPRYSSQHDDDENKENEGGDSDYD